jgi:cell division protein FtsZ
MADQVLYSGVACITDLMVKEGLINLDFADVRSVMREMGKAMMGTGEASGEGRAMTAAEAAIANPLLDETSMKGARGLLISITGGRDMTLFEVDEAATRIREEVDQDANIILGATFDEALEGASSASPWWRPVLTASKVLSNSVRPCRRRVRLHARPSAPSSSQPVRQRPHRSLPRQARQTPSQKPSCRRKPIWSGSWISPARSNLPRRPRLPSRQRRLPSRASSRRAGFLQVQPTAPRSSRKWLSRSRP